MALSFSKTGSALGGVAKTIFPGLIVSIIGGSFAFLVFNNPDKIRGKATMRAWESLKQYERLFIENSDRINCNATDDGLDRFKSNMLHQIQMTGENLKNVLDKESNVDNLMLAIINMRIDSYNEMKSLTAVLLDTLKSIDEKGARTQKELENIAEKWIKIHGRYMDECVYLKNRDTTTVNKILQELKKNYSINFIEDNFLPEITGLRNLLTGKWSIALYDINFELKPDGTGTWNALGKEYPSTWQLDSTMLSIKMNEAANTFKFSILRANNDVLSISQIDTNSGNTSFIACRQF